MKKFRVMILFPTKYAIIRGKKYSYYTTIEAAYYREEDDGMLRFFDGNDEEICSYKKGDWAYISEVK